MLTPYYGVTTYEKRLKAVATLPYPTLPTDLHHPDGMVQRDLQEGLHSSDCLWYNPSQ